MGLGIALVAAGILGLVVIVKVGYDDTWVHAFVGVLSFFAGLAAAAAFVLGIASILMAL